MIYSAIVIGVLFFLVLIYRYNGGNPTIDKNIRIKAKELNIDLYKKNQYIYYLRIKSKIPKVNDGKHFKILENGYWCTYFVYSLWREYDGDFINGDNGNYGNLVLVDIE